ncbi:MAG: hypothetical protein ACKOE7_07920, partial [Actinomycetota bacterium]
MATPDHGDDIRDALPDDLNITAFSGAYEFPDNSRRRIPGVRYLALAALCVLVRVAGGTDSPIVNGGWIAAAVLLAAVGLFSLTSGWRMVVDEKQALVVATRAVDGIDEHQTTSQRRFFGAVAKDAPGGPTTNSVPDLLCRSMTDRKTNGSSRNDQC